MLPIGHQVGVNHKTDKVILTNMGGGKVETSSRNDSGQLSNTSEQHNQNQN